MAAVTELPLLVSFLPSLHHSSNISPLSSSGRPKGSVRPSSQWRKRGRGEAFGDFPPSSRLPYLFPCLPIAFAFQPLPFPFGLGCPAAECFFLPCHRLLLIVRWEEEVFVRVDQRINRLFPPFLTIQTVVALSPCKGKRAFSSSILSKSTKNPVCGKGVEHTGSA